MTSEDFLRISGALPEAMLLIRRGAVCAANRAAERVFARATLLGEGLSELLAEEPDAIREYLRFASRTLDLVPGSLRVRGADGVVSYVAEACRLPPIEEGLVLLRLRPKVERLHSFILLNQKIDALTDQILRRQATEAKLRRAVSEAESANRLKDEFLATLSHELRTPLNAIVGWVHMLRAGGLDDGTRQRAIETIARNANLQNQLIADILDVSSVMAGKFRLDLQDCNLITIIESAVEAVQPAARAKEIEIQLLLDPEAGAMFGDPGRLQQIIWNLLSNALKFTPKRGRVRVSLYRINSYLEIKVEDNGPGIHADFLPYIFDRFRQADSSAARQYGGLGLGLAIVRSLTELHGGTISAENRDSGGASFRISLPGPSVSTASVLAGDGDRRHPRAEWPGGSGSAPPSLHGVKVLVVEDEADSRELIAALLEQCGAEVIAARSAREGIECLQRHKPDVILSDIGLPGEDGYSFLRQVRALAPEHGGHTPAAALTAFASTADRMRVLEAGFRLHVPKPVQPEELVTVVKSLVVSK